MKEFLAALSEIGQFQLFEINQTPITVKSVVLFFGVFIIFFLASRIITRGIVGRILRRFEIEAGIRFTMRRVTHYVVMIIGTLVAFQFIGIDLSGLAVIFGLLSVGIGFGLQNVTSNFISGIILLFERPITVGDRVTVGEVEGDVLSINMRSTTIRSINNISIIVPNTEFVASQVTNWSHGDPKIRLMIDVGVSYNSDPDLVVNTLREVAAGHRAVLKSPAPDVLLSSFGDSAWNMILLAWIDDPKSHAMIRSEINCEIVRRFRDKKIEIPFPQRDLHLRSPLPLPFNSEQRAAS